jgi:ABC-type transport system involved in cytochrome c biogenesis permease subunit
VDTKNVKPTLNLLAGGVGITGAAILVVSYFIFEPYWTTAAEEKAVNKVQVPKVDYRPWHSLPVQFEGRIKPLETAAIEAVRQITGRSKFEGHDPIAIFLSWMIQNGRSVKKDLTDWENYPFILCDHHGLRKMLFEHLPAARSEEEQEKREHGKYISPADIRSSPAAPNLAEELQRKHRKFGDKATQAMSPEERKAEEVFGRLELFDSISQRSNGLGNELQIASGWPKPGMPVNLALLSLFGFASARHDDPVGLVALDKVPGSPWFSLGQMRGFRRDAASWLKILRRRAALTPELYFSATQRQQLKEFQEQLKQGNGREVIADLEKRLGGQEGTIDPRDKEKLEDLKKRIRNAGTNFDPNEDKFRMLFLNYLELRFPDLYKEAGEWQQYPRDKGDVVLAAFGRVKEAYYAEDPVRFERASQDFISTVRQTSEEVGPYPGVDTIDLELAYNKVKPFMWAWVVMFLALALFVASLALKAPLFYALALAAYGVSLGLQVFGYYVRIYISGRPPVSTMYETVIWVSFMSAVFALILELIYRRKIIGLAGALVATVGLILADQLPLALDPKLKPLQPVLRSNFWLTIHVLTIVSSYAGGTLAWGLANVALALLAFGKPRRETLKVLSTYTYRAIQIAVLLLAAGTFLGGWWASYSWGRFWGWDPKETWALIALVCYVIPLHARYIGWVKDFGLAVAAVICYAAIVMCWYGVNFVLGAGLHSYGFGGGGPWWVFWAGLINIEWVLVASMIYLRKTHLPAQSVQKSPMETVEV